VRFADGTSPGTVVSGKSTPIQATNSELSIWPIKGSFALELSNMLGTQEKGPDRSGPSSFFGSIGKNG
jgi:hypothetical protein